MKRIVVVAANARSLAVNRIALVDEWLAEGHQVRALVPAGDADPVWLSRLPIPYDLVPLHRTSLNPFSDVRYIWNIYRHIRVLRPDIVFSYAAKPVVYGGVAARLAGVKRQYALVTGLGYVFSGDHLKQRLVRHLLARLYRIAFRFQKRVIFQNRDDAQMFTEMRIIRSSSQALVVAGSGVDLSHFRPSPAPTDPVSFILLARLVQDKGIGQFVKASQILKREFPNARFLVLGSHDATRPDAIPIELLEEWKRKGPVGFPGYQLDVRPFLRDASVLVLPTTYREGTPRSILEALAVGRAVITTDAPGCRETVLPGHNGYLVQPCDQVGLEEAMRRFLEHPELAEEFGRRSRVIAEEKYDVRKVVRDMVSGMELR